jgi:cytochrome b
MHARTSSDIQVWDPFVRVAHWTIALGFFVAYLTEDARQVHIWAGYVVGVLIVARVVWGFIGTRHARFADFVTGPVTASHYLWDLTRGRAKRYVGHSPAGGAMVIALLVSLAATVATGLIGYAQEGGRPLAPLYAETLSAGARTFTGEENEGGSRRDENIVSELHRAIANVTLGLVVFHILSVFLASFMHQENLARAMVTGRKHGDREPPMNAWRGRPSGE